MSHQPIPDRVAAWFIPTRAAWVLCLVALGVIAQSAQGRTAIVRTEDGNTFRGELVRQSAGVVVLNVQGIDATFKDEDIVAVELQDTPEEIYYQSRRQLASYDVSGRLALVREMLDLNNIRLAKFELNDLVREFPDDPAVQDELAIVDARLRLRETRMQTSFAEAVNADEDRPERRGESDDDSFLSRKQINLMKVYEIDLSTKPRLSIPNDTLESFFQKYADNRLVPSGRKDRSAFKRLEGYEQLDLMFRVQARDLYDQVDVKQEPEALSRFRRTVNPQYIARYFAPTFGQGQIPGLSLFNQRPEDEAEAYTNFYRLTQFRVDGNPMIDRANPELSLLLQWGLARESARYPAPDLEGWRPFFRTTDDSDFRRYAQWIDSLFKDDLDYGMAPPVEDDE